MRFSAKQQKAWFEKREAARLEMDRARKREHVLGSDRTLLRALANCMIIAADDKTVANEVVKILLPVIKLKKSKRVAFLILVLTGNRKQKGRPRKSEMQEAKDCIAGAKNGGMSK